MCLALRSSSFKDYVTILTHETLSQRVFLYQFRSANLLTLSCFSTFCLHFMVLLHDQIHTPRLKFTPNLLFFIPRIRQFPHPPFNSYNLTFEYESPPFIVLYPVFSGLSTLVCVTHPYHPVIYSGNCTLYVYPCNL